MCCHTNHMTSISTLQTCKISLIAAGIRLLCVGDVVVVGLRQGSCVCVKLEASKIDI